MKELQEKYQKLQAVLASFQSAAIAFSGGVDSAFLLKTAQNVLGENVLAVTVTSALFPQKELKEAQNFCKENGIRQIICQFDALHVEGFRQNPKNRCYLCKRELFRQITAIAEENHMNVVAEGSNLDDEGDYRPGLRAIEELHIKSPLREAELTKEEIRILSQKMQLPTWNKPSLACLASRLVYGETICEEKLHMAELAEQYLFDMGFRQVRVRIHGNMARIEVLPEELPRLIAEKNRMRIYTYFKQIGFSYVSADMGGYRTGSMNEILTVQEKKIEKLDKKEE